MKLPIYQVDAFASQLFAGNPAAVVRLEAPLDETTMQAIAAENNLAETAFVHAGESGMSIRWFTPTVEVDLCGHATLAAAHVYFEYLEFAEDRISFDSKSGPLAVERSDGQLFLDFPADHLEPVDPPAEIAQATGLEPQRVFRGRDDFLAVFDSESDIANMSPDFSVIAKLPARGLIATAKGNEVDFVSRMFAPQSGIPEDPVTGSAHTTLTPYWSERLGKNELSARQISARGGELVCINQGARIRIGGRATTYLIGQIFV
ncbi:MAG: PhzF family phenazine biosynthesis protein [Pseudomonadota bacterium]